MTHRENRVSVLGLRIGYLSVSKTLSYFLPLAPGRDVLRRLDVLNRLSLKRVRYLGRLFITFQNGQHTISRLLYRLGHANPGKVFFRD